MKYERITERRETPLVMSMWHGDSESLKVYNRLVELENKIEGGELIERTSEEYSAVRKQAVKGVLLTMLDRMDRLTGCGVPYHVKKFINDIAEENGVDLVKEEI